MVSLTLEMKHYSADFDIQSLTLQFETSRRTPPLYAWTVDTAWTNPFPRPRFDGFLVRRESLVKLINVGQGFQPGEGLFVTFAAKKGVLIDVAAYSSTSVPNDVQRLQSCAFNPMAPGCDSASHAQAFQHIRDWASAVLAVHLATFPIG
jgi:hypothetical protein